MRSAPAYAGAFLHNAGIVMKFFKKIIIGDVSTASRYFKTAADMLASGKRFFEDEAIAILAQPNTTGDRAIFRVKALDFATMLLGTFDPALPNIIHLWTGAGPGVMKKRGTIDMASAFDASGLQLLTPFNLKAYHTYDRKNVSLVRVGQPYTVQNNLKTTYDDWAFSFHSPADPVAPYTLSLTIDNGAYSQTFNQAATLVGGKYPLAPTVSALTDQANQAWQSVYGVDAFGPGALVPFLTVSVAATGSEVTASMQSVASPGGDDYWPPTDSDEYGQFDREGVYTVGTGITDPQVLEWEGVLLQPRNPQFFDYPTPDHFVVDVQSETYVRTNDLGYKKRVGQIVIWQKLVAAEEIDGIAYKRGQFKPVNTGIAIPDVSPIDVWDLAGTDALVVDSQLLSIAHFVFIMDSNIDEYFHMAIAATRRRFYLTTVESRVFSKYFQAFVIKAVMRSTPDTLLPQALVWTSRRQVGADIKQYAFGGYVHDRTGRYSGLLDYCFGPEAAGDDQTLFIEPGIIVRLAEEDDDSNATHGLWNLSITHTIADLYALIGVPNPFPAGLDISETVYLKPSTMISYIYGGSIIVILGVTGDQANRVEIPTGVFSILIADGTAQVIHTGYVADSEGVRRAAKTVKTSNDGRHIYLLEERIDTGEDGNVTHIDMDTGTVTRNLFSVPAGQPANIAFMQPLYART